MDYTVGEAEETKGEIEQEILDEVPEQLKSQFSSVKELKNQLMEKLSSGGGTVTPANTEFREATLWEKDAQGRLVRATSELFERIGRLTITLPYPVGTGRYSHDFRVAHMFAEEANGHRPGEIETVPVTKTDAGIEVSLGGLSPIAITWEVADNKAVESLPQTGDTERPLVYGLFGLAALIGLGWFIRKK